MGIWNSLDNQPTFGAGTMLLLTDGTVLCHQSGTKNWFKLTPDKGSYRRGKWSTTETLPDNANIPKLSGGPTNAPLYFASAVLGNGTVLTAGGEYNSGIPNADTLAAQIYDPQKDHWTAIDTPFGFVGIGDATSCVLADGRFLLGQYNGTAAALYNPATGKWAAAAVKGDPSSEETYTLLPDGSVLSVQTSNAPNAEKYLPATDQWVTAGNTGASLPQPCPNLIAEIGPAILLPDGRVFAIGASGSTALYTPPTAEQGVAAPGTWAPGPLVADSVAVFDHTMQRITAVSRAAGNLDLFVIGFDNAVWSTFWTQDGGWNPGGWFQLHPETVFDHTTQHIAAVSRAAANLDLFVIGFDNAIWSTFWTQDGGWNPGGWFQLHPDTVFDHTTQQIAVVSRAAGNLDLFVIGFDNAVWSTFWDWAQGWG